MNKQRKPDLNVPVLFQQLEEYNADDTRFIKVKIYLMHTGENHNGSYFDKKVIEKAIPSLANTPILAYIEENSDNQKDFSDHRMVLVQEEGQYKVKYIGQAIGVIPENNNAKFEMRLCDDGIEREFLTVEGLLWTKFNDPIDIMLRDGVKAQSMELHDDYEGEFKDDGLFHFTEFKFFGACGLGADVLPAMQNATIELFSSDTVSKVINEKMEQYKIFMNKKEEGGIFVKDKIKLLEKYNFTKEDLDIDIKKISMKELEEKVKEKFALTVEQFRDEIISELSEEKIKDDWDYEYPRYSYVDCQDNIVIAYDMEDWKLYGFEFTIDGDEVIIDFDSKQRYKVNFIPFDEGEDIDVDFELYPKEAIEYAEREKEKEVKKDMEITITEKVTEIENINKEYEKLKEEVKELREFKKEVMAKEREVKEEKLFNTFKDLEGMEEYEELKEKASEYTIEELEKELALLYVKSKANFSIKDSEDEMVTFELPEVNNDKPETPYDNLFEKYGG